MPSDGASSPSNDWQSEPAPGTAPGSAPYGTGEQPFSDPYTADPYAAGGYGAQLYGSGQNPGLSPDQQYGAPSYEGQSYGGQSYGVPSYGAPSYGAQPFDPQAYGGQPYGAQPFGAQPYGVQPYGAQSYGVQPYGQVPQAARKDPALMLVASLIIPGLGTMINGETGKGIGILAGYFIGALLSVILIGLPIMFGFWIWGMVDAYNGAKAHNARHGLP